MNKNDKESVKMKESTTNKKKAFDHDWIIMTTTIGTNFPFHYIREPNSIHLIHIMAINIPLYN